MTDSNKITASHRKTYYSELAPHIIRTRNQYYFYDANTCSIIRINETMYDILKNKENFLELEQLKKLYENGFLQSKEDIIIEHPASSE